MIQLRQNELDHDFQERETSVLIHVLVLYKNTAYTDVLCCAAVGNMHTFFPFHFSIFIQCTITSPALSEIGELKQI